jgi:hypothetical protein
MLAQTIGLIIGVVFLVIVSYSLIAKSVSGPVKTQAFGATCTFSSYSRGAIIETLEKSAIPAIISTFSFVGNIGLLQLGPEVPLLGARTYVGGYYGQIEGMDAGSRFVVRILSSIPLVCPAVTIDVGHEDAEMDPLKFHSVLGGYIIQVYDMYAKGEFDPLAGADPPNPRTVLILETHLTKKVNFEQVYFNITEMYGEQVDWFSSGRDAKIVLYCEEGLGSNPGDFDTCEVKDSRIYIMYKDEHPFARYTVGTHVCKGNIQEHAVEFAVTATVAAEDPVFAIFTGRDDLDAESPWQIPHDLIVICVEPINR